MKEAVGNTYCQLCLEVRLFLVRFFSSLSPDPLRACREGVITKRPRVRPSVALPRGTVQYATSETFYMRAYHYQLSRTSQATHRGGGDTTRELKPYKQNAADRMITF